MKADPADIGSEATPEGASVSSDRRTQDRMTGLPIRTSERGSQQALLFCVHLSFYSRRNLTPRCLARQVLACDLRATSFRRTWYSTSAAARVSLSSGSPSAASISRTVRSRSLGAAPTVRGTIA